MSTKPRHMHACKECGRPFYLCSERDCALAPDACQGCEMDRMDAYLSQPSLPIVGDADPIPAEPHQEIVQ